LKAFRAVGTRVGWITAAPSTCRRRAFRCAPTRRSASPRCSPGGTRSGCTSGCSRSVRTLRSSSCTTALPTRTATCTWDTC
jgi:hypothetical protein